ncbi:MAG: ABC transporter permease [Clostridia bacterium]|nr:ABC transporter permease [Clostridia bacterium]
MFKILNREFNAYFTSPVGYIFLGFTLILSGWFFSSMNLFYQSADMYGFFSNLQIIFIFLVPLLTMRLIAEDRRTKVDQLLLTSPLSITEIVLGKFLAAFSLFLVAMAVMCFYPLIINIYGKVNFEVFISMLIGFVLLGAALISVGLFISSLTESQITSAIVSFVIMLVFWLSEWLASVIGVKFISKAILWFSVIYRYKEFTIGVLDFSTLIFYISFTALFLFFTIQSIDNKRWN